MEVALRFALKDLEESHKIAVVFQIEFNCNKGFFEMTKGCSAFPEEDEVLVQDGLEYSVLSKTLETVLCDDEGEEKYETF